MELNLQPRAASCVVSGRPFAEGDRVASLLVRTGAGDVLRVDALEAEAASYAAEGYVICRWVQVFKPNAQAENADRTLKLSAENLFLSLADPATELTPESARLARFLALLLERKRLLRPKGRSADGTKERFEHAKTKQLHEVPAVELTPEFFAAVQEQLSVLVGAPAPKPGDPQPAGALSGNAAGKTPAAGAP